MKFNVGDRVAFYTVTGRETGIVEVAKDDFVEVWVDGTKVRLPFHKKQCRLLKKNCRKRRVWIHEQAIHCEWVKIYREDDKAILLDGSGFVEFIEARKKK